MPFITPRTFKGTRDFLPPDMRKRERIIGIMKSVFTRYGFAPLETPAVEFLEILAGKYGDEADKLLYPLARKGGKELALRYDLTVPLARVIAMNPHLPKPFKRYQIQPVWRADNPQLKRGRYREFYQCDVDTVGSYELMADAEIVALMTDVFDDLNIGKFLVRINSRKILKGLITGMGFDEDAEHQVCRSIDKMDRGGLAAVEKELLQNGYPQKSVANLCGILDKKQSGKKGLELLEAEVQKSSSLDEGIDDIRSILEIISEMDVDEEKVVFDFALARGLDYYTGPIFEVILPDRPDIGSVAGGGRYDDLVGLFSKEKVPAVGTSFGFERIHAILEDSPEFNSKGLGSDVDFLVCFYSEEMRADCLKITRQLRESGIRVEMYFKPDKLKKQFNYANKKNIPFVVLYGPDEKSEGKCAIKDMNKSKQDTIEFSKLQNAAEKISSALNR